MINSDGLFFTPLKGKNAYIKNWQTKELDKDEAIAHGGTGIGIVHGLSGTCCIDIDDNKLARSWLKENDINMTALLKDAFQVLSPNSKTSKAIFRLPPDSDLPKLTKSVEGKSFIEFRSGGHQDAWPGSQYHFTGAGFNDWDKTFYTHKGTKALTELPIDVVTLWVKLAESNSGNSGERHGGESQDMEEVIGIITGGLPGLHNAINKYAYMQINDGVAPGAIEATIKGLMMACPVKDGRWEQYYNDVPRSIEGVQVEEVVIPGAIKDNQFTSKIPWPPGMLGEIAQNAYDMQRYQYKEVAVISAVGLVAGIAGRKFNISGTGLNVYLTLIMKTGMGKDSIRKFVHSTMNGINDGGVSSSFVGPGRFTVPKSVLKTLKDARCRISVFTEAGLLLRSKAGDNDGLTRVLLSLYSCSGTNEYSDSEIYSKGEDSIESLRAPCLTIINEATPETLLGAFKHSGALENGHLPRQSIYRITGKKPYINFQVKTEVDGAVRERLKILVKLCSSIQASPNPSAWEMVPEDVVQEDIHIMSKQYTDMENDYRDSDPLRSIMASRALLKALKFAALASVVNHEGAVIKV